MIDIHVIEVMGLIFVALLCIAIIVATSMRNASLLAERDRWYREASHLKEILANKERTVDRIDEKLIEIEDNVRALAAKISGAKP